MDKKDFFFMLSDEAAKPDQKFINKLRKEVLGVASGGSGGGNNRAKRIILSIFISSVLLAALISYTSASRRSTTTNDDNYATAQLGVRKVVDSPAYEDVLSEESSDVDTIDKTPGSERQQTHDIGAETAPPVDETQVAVVDTNSSAAPVIEEQVVEPPIEYWNVGFWNVPVFKLSPTIPETVPHFSDSKVIDVTYDWGKEGSPDSVIEPDYFVARAVTERTLASGKYTLQVSADDGVRVFLNNRLVFERWLLSPGGKTDSISFAINDDSAKTNITVEYFEHTNEASFSIQLLKN